MGPEETPLVLKGKGNRRSEQTCPCHVDASTGFSPIVFFYR